MSLPTLYHHPFFFFCLWQCVLYVVLLKNQTIVCEAENRYSVIYLASFKGGGVMVSMMK